MCCNFCDLFGCESNCGSVFPGFVSGSCNRRCCCNGNGILGGIVAGTNCCRRCCCRDRDCDRDCDRDRDRDRDCDCDRRSRCD